MATTHTDCRSETGVTVGLVDAVIAVLRILAHRDLDLPEVQEALTDEDLRTVLYSAPPVSFQDTAPAPRQPRVWQQDDAEPNPCPRVVMPADGRERCYSEDSGGWALRNELGDSVEQWDELPKPITEVSGPTAGQIQASERNV